MTDTVSRKAWKLAKKIIRKFHCNHPTAAFLIFVCSLYRIIRNVPCSGAQNLGRNVSQNVSSGKNLGRCLPTVNRRTPVQGPVTLTTQLGSASRNGRTIISLTHIYMPVQHLDLFIYFLLNLTFILLEFGFKIENYDGIICWRLYIEWTVRVWTHV